MEDTRFLALGVSMGHLTPDIPSIILQVQTATARRGSHRPRVGDLLQEHGFLGPAGCEAIAAEQEKRRTILPRVSALRLNPTSASKWKVLVAFIGALGVLGSVLYFLNPLAISISVAGFIVMIINLALDHVATIDRPISLSLWYALKSVFYFTVATLLTYGLYLATTLNLTEIISRHTHSAIQQEVGIWVSDLKLTLYIFVAVVLLLLTFSLWKYRGLQLSEARFGEMKDVLIRVERQLRSTTASVEQRQREAIALVLRSLCTLIQLSPWIQAVKTLKCFVRDRTHVVTAWYLLPNNTNKCFHIVCAAYPEAKMPREVYEHFQFLKDNYQPAFYNEVEFNKLVAAARGENCTGWRSRLLNMAEQRSRCSSLTGYVYAKQYSTMELDAINSIYFDHYSIAKMGQGRGLTKKQVPWFTIGSLIGCPIVGDLATGKGKGVLLVVNNTRYGFHGEDFEVVTVAAQIISRILRG